MQAFWTFFAIAVVLAGLAKCCYYVVVWRLVKQGVRVKFLGMPKDIFRVLRQYQELAPENAWSLRPVYGFWLLSIPALCAGAIAAASVNLPPSPQSKRFAHLPSMGAAVIWVSSSNFLIALVFSYRVFRYLSARGMTLRDWKRWASDEYARADFALAILGWIGFLLGSFMLLKVYLF